MIAIEPRGPVSAGNVVLGVLIPPTITRFGAAVLSPMAGVNPLVSKGVAFVVSSIVHFTTRTSFTLGWWASETADMLGIGAAQAVEAIKGMPKPAVKGIEGVVGHKMGMDAGGVTGRMFNQEAGGIVGRRFEQEAGGVMGRRFGQDAGDVGESEVEILKRLKEKLEMRGVDGGYSSHVVVGSR